MRCFLTWRQLTTPKTNMCRFLHAFLKIRSLPWKILLTVSSPALGVVTTGKYNYDSLRYCATCDDHDHLRYYLSRWRPILFFAIQPHLRNHSPQELALPLVITTCVAVGRNHLLYHFPRPPVSHLPTNTCNITRHNQNHLVCHLSQAQPSAMTT